MSLEQSIQNVGEYFSAHYLAGKDGFNKDIGEHVKRWKEQGSQSTPRKLQALGEAFFAAKSEALDYPEPALRSKAAQQGNTKELHRWHTQLLHALGYQQEPVAINLDTEQKHLPALLRLHRHSQPWLVIVEAPFCLNSGDYIEEALEEFVEAGFSINGIENKSTSNKSTQDAATEQSLPPLHCEWEKAIALLFKQEDRPRWAILLAGSKIYLFDAHTYAQGRYIYVDLDAAFSSKDKSAFDAIAALLSHECLAPKTESDEVLHEKLREGSLKQTHAVSESLQGAVREAIELIANGWIEQRRAQSRGYKQLGEREQPLPDGSREVTAEQLKHDALVYVYRILFCLYAEARGGELGVLPITDDVYRLGYSLEALRDLAEMGEPGTQTEDGSYYAEHLNRLFQLVHEGFHPEESEATEKTEKNHWQIQLPEQNELFDNISKQLTLDKTGRKQLATGNAKTFVIQPLTATLFAPNATPLLNRVLLSNRVLHQVIRRLSLGTGSKSKQIGRINYAELGIVQLGSVYEGLLSYKGFFAKEDLIQVVKAGKPKIVNGKNEIPVVYDDAVNPKEPSWFVPQHRLADFKQGEVVIERRTNQPRIYRQGEFILHLNGVDRVNSASYYTPEVLTRALVKEALKERLKDFGPAQADEILQLKICEPAMGSAAFLVEAIDQLARHYLVLKQEQLGENIDPSRFEEELGRVKHYIAVHNVYGVDLNPTAVELGALSLWLASIHSLRVQEGENGARDIYRPGQTPWFGLRLRAGNSLIGARRAVWTYDQLATGKHYGKKALAPRQLKPGELRKENEIYHFLVWDEDMAPAARDALMKSHWKDECTAINEWNKKQIKQNWSPEELAKARDICQKIDELWQDYAQHRAIGLKQTECTATVWPLPANSPQALKPGPSLEFQEQVKANLEAQSGAFQRLKLLMDSWCSFYFWPLERSDALPSRAAWLAAAEVLLGCEAVESEQARANLDFTLGENIQLEALFAESQQHLPDTSKLAAAVPWFGVARTINNSQNFHHWELIFTEILGPGLKTETEETEIKEAPKGFDLMFGNPPWMKVTWNDAPLLSEYDPLLGAREAKSAKYNSERPKLLAGEERKVNYRDAFVLGEGASMFLNDRTLYPALAGVQTNLYKNFIERSWDLLRDIGIAGLLHPEGVYDDPNGGSFRKRYFERLTAHYQLKNELILFADVHHVMSFSINTYQGAAGEIKFKTIFNLFSPKAIEQCSRKDLDNSPIPGIKNEEGGWETRGHPQRIITITQNELQLFAKLFEESGTPAEQARLPQVHSQPLMKVLEKFSQAPKRLGDLEGEYFATVMFDETYAQRDGIITRMENPSFQPQSSDEWVISGPHFFVGNPLNKTPRTSCTANGHYDAIDLENIAEDYLPRAVYRPGDKDGSLDKFCAAIPEWPKPQKPTQDQQGRWHGGFWPIEDSHQQAWEALLEEPLVLFGIDRSLPGASTARQFAYFGEWQGDVIAAVSWLAENHCDTNAEKYRDLFADVRCVQGEPFEPEQDLPKPQTYYAKYALRAMCQPANERTLIGALMPHGVSGINAVRFVTFKNTQILLSFSSFANSILADFFMKVKGRSNIHEDDIGQLPLLSGPAIRLANYRTLRLSALTSAYQNLWHELYTESINQECFVAPVEGEEYEGPWQDLYEHWQRGSALRGDKVRRQANLEVDVLAAIALGLSLEQLIQVYTVQFPVMKAYEEADQYDARGQRLPNTTRKDAGAKELREALKNHDGESPITVSWQIDNGLQTVTKTFCPPFKHVDRIEDYKIAYRVFSERLGLNNNSETME